MPAVERTTGTTATYIMFCSVVYIATVYNVLREIVASAYDQAYREFVPLSLPFDGAERGRSVFDSPRSHGAGVAEIHGQDGAVSRLATG